MTPHFKWSMGIIGVVAAILLGLFVWLQSRLNRIVHLPTVPANAALAADERELISFNEKTHRVMVTTSSGTIKMYARNPTVRIKKDGRVVVDRHLFGFESRLLLGGGFSDTSRLMLGYMPVYWGAFDASLNVGVTWDHRYVAIKPYIAAGYNFYGNAALNLGINPAGLKELDGVLFISVKL